MRWLAAFVILFCVPAQAQQALDPADARLELHLEERAHTPHPGEMILLSIQGTFRVPVVREKLLQPALDGLDWMQLGEDRWFKEMEDGFEVLKFERRMALFPQAPGEVEISPFTHRLDLLNRRGREVKIELVSDSATLSTEPRPEIADWWFPVRGLEIEDNWSNQPEALDPGSAALRIVSLIIDGSPPQRIPPMPEMTGAGAHIFPHPEHRIVSLGPDGPITRVFWRWTIRPEQGSAGYLDPMRIAYFDAESREAKEVTLSAQRVAYLDGPQAVVDNSAPVPNQQVEPAQQGSVQPPFALPGFALPLVLALGALLGLVLSLGHGSWRLPLWLQGPADAVGFRRAARRGDLAAMRLHAHRIVARRGAATPDSLKRLDRALYGSGASTPSPRELLTAMRPLIAAQRS